jgi:DNA-binding transcriptional LysR family regulator
MNWDDFDAFCQVVEHGGFTAAARALDRPKSSLSASVARLEEQLGTRLLERTTRSLRLTEAGEALYRDISKPFSQLRELAVDAVAKGTQVQGTLRIAAPYEFGAHHLAEVACRLMARHPQLKVHIDVEHSRVALFASPELLARHPGLAAPEDLNGLPLLAGADDADWEFTAAGGDTAKVEVRNPRLRSGNAGIRLEAAIAGLGVARITATFCAAAVRQGRLVVLLPEWRCAPLRIYALLPGRRLMPAKVREFMDTLEALPTHQG